ncbi:hypothetical protein [Bosea sp. Root381]|uniref:hypothetical protein n=1 Tax=Bosea sp. Root381 TaxID=1736524 RepID=UPI0012E3CF84|nr:hypothetical protein [Bosea sp. Root381]
MDNILKDRADDSRADTARTESQRQSRGRSGRSPLARVSLLRNMERAKRLDVGATERNRLLQALHVVVFAERIDDAAIGLRAGERGI